MKSKYESKFEWGPGVDRRGNITDPDLAFGELSEGTDLDEDGNFFVWSRTETMNYGIPPGAFSVAGVKEAMEVYTSTPPEQQRVIDEWFTEDDFGAVIIDQLVNNGPYDAKKHLDMQRAYGSAKWAEAQAKMELALRKGNLASVELELRNYEEEHAAAISEARKKHPDHVDLGNLGELHA